MRTRTKWKAVSESLFAITFFLISNLAYPQAPVSLTTSGGVSLGIYEGGFLFYSILKMPTSIEKSPVIFTGASAGAINSLLAGITYCSSELRENDDFQESLFWKMWMPLSFDNFTSKNNGKSLLDRSFVNPFMDYVEKIWKQGLKKDCEFYIGVSLTRKNPYIFYPKIGETYPRVYEPISFKITGKGKGIEPKVENIHLNSGVQIFMPFNSNGFDNFTQIKKALLASSSFPVVFPPEKLHYCFADALTDTCDNKSIQSDLFIDGGIYNNSPLDIAYKISKVLGHSKKTNFYYLNPSIKRYPEPEGSQNENTNGEGLIQESLNLFQDFITFSRVGNISSFLGEHPDLTTNLVSVKTSIPLASDSMYGFFGFFEKDFRIFDFYLGMLEAKNLQGSVKTMTKEKFSFLNPNWQILECMSAVIYGPSPIEETCVHDIESISDKNFNALFKTAIDQLIHYCSRRGLKSDFDSSSLCKRISQQKLTGTPFERWPIKLPQSQGETHTSYVTRLLAENDFEFKDLKLKKGQGQLAMIAIKDRIVHAIKRIKDQQPKEHQFVLSQFSSPALNFIYYSPPLTKGYILAGGNMIDLHRSHASYSNKLSGYYFRYGYGLNINGVKEIFKNNNYGLGLLPNLSLSYEIDGLNTELWQHEVAVRAGYQFSTKNDLKSDTCKISEDEREFSRCSNFISQFTYGLTFFEKARIQLIASWIPFSNETNKRFRNIELLLGWQF